MKPVDIAKFWSKVLVSMGSKDCWFWDGALAWEGYGVFQGRSARTAAWEIASGKKPSKLIRMRCRQDSCVRPSHMTQRREKELQTDDYNRYIAAERRWIGQYGHIGTDKDTGQDLYEFKNNGLYVPENKSATLRDREEAFRLWWMDNKPPFETEVGRSDMEVLLVQFLPSPNTAPPC